MQLPGNHVEAELAYIHLALAKQSGQNPSSLSIEGVEYFTEIPSQNTHEILDNPNQNACGLGQILSPEPAKDFHLFTKLPPEIQCMVWNFALPGPRMIQVKGEVTESSRENGLKVNFTSHRLTVNSNPESRMEWSAMDASDVLRSLRLSCQQSKKTVEQNYKNELPSWKEGRISFNGALDIILIQNFAQLMADMKMVEALEHNYSLEPCFNEIQILGVPRPCMAEDMPLGRYNIFAPEFTCFKRLSKIFAVTGAPDMLEIDEEQELAADHFRSRWDIKGIDKETA